jgi:AcrR family transcriptional regulator
MALKAERANTQMRRAPMSSRGELKRKQILDAAAKVLARRGFAETQLSEIAEEAGTLPGSLYYHFASREELIEEVLHEGVSASFARARAVVDALPAASSPLERLKAALRAHLRFQLVESDYARAVSRAIGQCPQDMWKRINQEFRGYGRFFDNLIGAAVRAGELDSRVDRHALRMLVIGAANWASEWYRSDGSLTADEIGDVLIRLLVRGVATGE